MAAAAWLTRRGVRPNQISVCSVLFAALAGLCLLLAAGAEPIAQVGLPIVAAAFIELRLLCNMLDGMVAIEGGLQTRSGVVFNEVPDRLADTLTLVLAGYALPWAAWGSALGWAAAVLAVLTAYVRALGGSIGLAQDFGGPMAKPHRMHLLAGACVLAGGEALLGSKGLALTVALVLIVVGSALTVARRTVGIVRLLERT